MLLQKMPGRFIRRTIFKNMIFSPIPIISKAKTMLIEWWAFIKGITKDCHHNSSFTKKSNKDRAYHHGMNKDAISHSLRKYILISMEFLSKTCQKFNYQKDFSTKFSKKFVKKTIKILIVRKNVEAVWNAIKND